MILRCKTNLNKIAYVKISSALHFGDWIEGHSINGFLLGTVSMLQFAVGMTLNYTQCEVPKVSSVV